MKSREGTVVDADELVDEMIQTARETTLMLGKVEDFTELEAEKLFRKLGLGALKYYILKVDAKKTMLFDPAESIDFNGNTGPFIQYSFARICSVIRKTEGFDSLKSFKTTTVSLDRNLLPKEKDIIKILYQFPTIIIIAASNYSPSIIAQFVYDLAKTFNTFYHDYPIADAENTDTSIFRLQLSFLTSEIIKESLRLLGIEVPEKM
jgi:arginyl-tRNA synthetase